MEPIFSGPLTRSPPVSSRENNEQLMVMARKLEANFLSEMLKAAGLGATPSTFGGGAGEDQFASFLRQAQADEMVKAGGIGLAEALFESLKEHRDGS